MKKSLHLFAATAIVVSLASCSNEEILNSVEGDGNVVFTVSLPGEGYGSRAFSDGLSADKLVYAVYDAASGNLVTTDSKDFGNALSTNVSLTLANGKSYDIAFFAYNPDGEEVYAFNTADKTVSINYAAMADKYNANDYDAFYKLEKIETVTGPLQRTVTLTRPFAQVNWGTRDLAEDAVKAEYGDAAANLKTKVTFSEVYGGFNMLDGSMVGDAQKVEFIAAARPDASEEAFPVQPDTYKYLSMAYILVPADQRLIDAELTPMAGANENQPVKVSNLPVQANYRTNIYGALLTNPLDFEIVKDNEYETPDNNVEIVIVRSAQGLVDAVKNGGAIEVPAGVDLDLNEILSGVGINVEITKPTTLTVNGTIKGEKGGQFEVKSDLALNGTGTVEGGIRGLISVADGGSLTASGIKFSTEDSYRGGDVWNEGGGDMTFTNCTFDSNMASVYFQPASENNKLVMKNCVVNNTSRNSIINPETGGKTWSYAIRVQGGKAEISDCEVTGIQGCIAVGQGAVADIYSGTYKADDSEPNKGDGFYALYTATDGTANVYGGNFSSPRRAVYNGNEDTTTKFGYCYLYGGKYSQKAYDQDSQKEITLPDGYEYKAIEGDDLYKWEVVKTN